MENQEAVCLFCHKNKVPLQDWNRRCKECKALQKDKDEQEKRVILGSRMPAAVIKTDNGEEIFVDKFGDPVENPGYDLKNDPRGWKHTGKLPKERTIIK